jgi:hypothetical protein
MQALLHFCSSRLKIFLKTRWMKKCIVGARRSERTGIMP